MEFILSVQIKNLKFLNQILSVQIKNHVIVT